MAVFYNLFGIFFESLMYLYSCHLLLFSMRKWNFFLRQAYNMDIFS